MRHVVIALPVLGAVIAFCWGLSGCDKTLPPLPVVQTVEVKVPVATPCPDKRAPAPAYPDTPGALKGAPDIFALAQIYKQANILLHARTAEDDGQIAACATAPRAAP